MPLWGVVVIVEVVVVMVGVSLFAVVVTAETGTVVRGTPYFVVLW